MRSPGLFDPENKDSLEQAVFGIDPTEEEIIRQMTEQKYSPADNRNTKMQQFESETT